MGVLLALVVFFVYDALTPDPPRITERYLNDVIARHLAEATPVPSVAARVYAAIWPSVVHISTSTKKEDGTEDEDAGGNGSGVILDESGLILTALHVVTGVTEIEVYFADGTHSPAIISGQQPEKDIAVLRVLQPPAVLIPATLGIPQALQVGDEAIVVGSPFGIPQSLSAGVISGLNRTFTSKSRGEPLHGLIQFDAAVNPGNSGGPLFNRNGEVVGIVTGLINPTDQNVFIGIGFAVPIDVAASVGGPPPF